MLQDLDRWRMRYKLGAEHLEQVRPWPSPRWVFRLARSAPVGPTHAVDAATCLASYDITRYQPVLYAAPSMLASRALKL